MGEIGTEERGRSALYQPFDHSGGFVRERINKKEWTATDSGREEGWVRRPKEPGRTLLRPSQQIGGSPACRHSLRGLAHTRVSSQLCALSISPVTYDRPHCDPMH